MYCTNCGGDGGVTERRLRFEGGDDPDRELTLHLCDTCLEEFRDEEDIVVE